MMIKDLAGLPRKTIEEKITNRLLLNFGYTMLGYVLLYIFYMYAMGRIGNILTYRYTMLGIFIALAITTIVLYALSFSKSPLLAKHTSAFRNYGHMTLAVALVSVYLNLPFYTPWMPVEAAPASFRPVLAFIKNTRQEYYVVAILLFVYLVITTVYHMYAMKKLTKIKH